jgi:hypothetical protein
MTDIALVALRWATAMFKQFPVMSWLSVAMLLGVIAIVAFMATHVTTGIPVGVTRVQQLSFSNYTGFPVSGNREDSQSFNYGEVTITNISPKEKVALELTLHITGPDGTNIKIPANLVGPYGMILGKDDRPTKYYTDAPFGEVKKFFRNPIELAPGQVERKLLTFLCNWGDSPLRDQMVAIVSMGQNYNFDLEITDFISGNRVTVRIPGEYRGD